MCVCLKYVRFKNFTSKIKNNYFHSGQCGLKLRDRVVRKIYSGKNILVFSFSRSEKHQGSLHEVGEILNFT